MQQVLIAHPSNSSQLTVIKAFFEAINVKFEIEKESPYNPAFIKKIEGGRKQVKQGKTTKIKLDDIWK